MAKNHPDLPVHFRTGLRALAVVGGRPVWPILGGSENVDGGAGQGGEGATGSGAGQQQGQGSNDGGTGTGYPANTPVAEMNDKQQAAYWKAQNRKQEDRNKAVGLTAEEAAELRAKAKKADDYDAANATEIEKREKAARDEVTKQLTSKFGAQSVEDAFRLVIGDRRTADEVTDFLADLNLERFVGDGGRVDTSRVIARANQFAPATGTVTTTTKGPTVTGHGSSGAVPVAGANSVAAGADLWTERHPKKAS